MIRKSFAVAVAILLITMLQAPVYAQTVGFKLGPTFSKVDVEDADDSETLTSLGGGGFIRFGLAGLALQLEVLALTKGGKEDLGGGAQGKVKLDYIELPLLLHFGFGSGGVMPYLMVGPTFGFNIGCTIEIEDSGGQEDEFDCEDDPIDPAEPKDLDIGAAGVAGLGIPLGPGRVTLEGRYTHGFTNIFEDPSSNKNRSWAIFGGYAIPIGRLQ